MDHFMSNKFIFAIGIDQQRRCISLLKSILRNCLARHCFCVSDLLMKALHVAACACLCSCLQGCWTNCLWSGGYHEEWRTVTADALGVYMAGPTETPAKRSTLLVPYEVRDRATVEDVVWGGAVPPQGTVAVGMCPGQLEDARRCIERWLVPRPPDTPRRLRVELHFQEGQQVPSWAMLCAVTPAAPADGQPPGQSPDDVLERVYLQGEIRLIRESNLKTAVPLVAANRTGQEVVFGKPRRIKDVGTLALQIVGTPVAVALDAVNVPLLAPLILIVWAGGEPRWMRGPMFTM